MAEPAGPPHVPVSTHRSAAIVAFGIAAFVWTVWLGGIIASLSDHDL